MEGQAKATITLLSWEVLELPYPTKASGFLVVV